MATPKLNRLAQAFMGKIQDPITLDGGSPEKFLAGTVVRTVDEIERYLNSAGQKLFDTAWKAAQPLNDEPGSVSHKKKFMNLFPELFKTRSITLTFASEVTSVDLTVDRNDVHDILDSIISGGGGTIEVWDQTKLADAISESDPFYSSPRVTSANPGMILQQPLLYIFPNDITATTYIFNLNYIQNIKNPDTGDILRTGGTYDIPYSEMNLDTISDIAAQLFNKDDFQEDAG